MSTSRVCQSPICWFGGKHRLAPKIVALMPSHERYVEVFGGGGSVLFAKPPVPIEVYNDVDERLVNFFRVLRNPTKFRKFAKAVQCIPVSRSEFNVARGSMLRGSDIDRAVAVYVTYRQSFAATGTSWGYTITKSSRGMAGICSKWMSAVDQLPAIHSRLMRVQIECNDWRKVLDAFDGPEALFYLDPPYVPSTRKNGKYAFELSELDHHELVERILNLKARVALSGYPNTVYDPLVRAGWQRLEWDAYCSASGRTRTSAIRGVTGNDQLKRTEALWINFKPG